MIELSKSVQLEIARAENHKYIFKQTIIPIDDKRLYYSYYISGLPADFQMHMDLLFDNTLFKLSKKKIILDNILTPSGENIKTYFSKCIIGAKEQSSGCLILPQYYPNVLFNWINNILDDKQDDRQEIQQNNIANKKNNSIQSYISLSGNIDHKFDIYRQAVNFIENDSLVEDITQWVYKFLFEDCKILSATYLHRIAVILIESGKHKDSKYFFEQSIYLNPAYHQSYMRIGEIYSAEKIFKLTIQYNLKAIEILENPEIDGEKYDILVDGLNSYKAEYYHYLGEAYQNLGDNLTALSFFNKAKKMDVGYFGYKYRGVESWDELVSNTKNLYLDVIEKSELSDQEYDDYFDKQYNKNNNNIPKSKPDNLEATKKELIQRNQHINNMSPVALNFLINSEIIFNQLIGLELTDYSALFLGYTKVIETELKDKIYKNLPKILRNEIGWHPASLGSYKHKLSDDKVILYINNNYSREDQMFLINDLKSDLSNILTDRNGSAHTGILEKQKVIKIREMCIDSSFMNSLVSIKTV